MSGKWSRSENKAKKRRDGKKRKRGPRTCRQKCSDCGRIETVSRWDLLRCRTASLFGMWRSAESASSGVGNHISLKTTQAKGEADACFGGHQWYGVVVQCSPRAVVQPSWTGTIGQREVVPPPPASGIHVRYVHDE